MNSIEEYQNLVALLEQALKFYAYEDNYIENKDKSLINIDKGSQARFALNKIKEINEINQEIQKDYIKIIATYKEDMNVKGEDLINTLNKLKNDINNLR